MNRLQLRWFGGAVFLVGLVAAGLLAAQTVSAAGSRNTTASGVVHMRFNLQRFQLDRTHRRLVARGNVVASYRSGGTVVATTTHPTVLTVKRATATNCSVLHLELGELRLELLGLIVSLTPVNAQSIVLDISANPTEALGKLFCQVLQAVQGTSVSTASKVTATTKLTKAVTARNQSGLMSLNVPVHSQSLAQTTTGGQCPVLDLVLGPLNLDLLGLVVQLNQVDLNVSANPVGTLGTLFCQLAGTTSSTTTAPATTT